MTRSIEAVVRQPVIYPESDGKPMGETETHRQELSDTIEVLKEWFRSTENIYVGGNMFLYYEEGNRHKNVCPDVFVVRGVPKQRRRIYQVWHEGQLPCFVLELTSKSTKREDLREKMALYAELGVREYLICDPLQEYLRPALQGYELVDGRYQRMVPAEDGSLRSRELGVLVRLEADGLRFVDPTTGERLLKPVEVAEARRVAEKARRAAETARRIADTARRNAEKAQQRADTALALANQQAQEATRLAEAEAEARRAAEAEVERLRAELARLRSSVA